MHTPKLLLTTLVFAFFAVPKSQALVACPGDDREVATLELLSVQEGGAELEDLSAYETHAVELQSTRDGLELVARASNSRTYRQLYTSTPSSEEDTP